MDSKQQLLAAGAALGLAAYALRRRPSTCDAESPPQLKYGTAGFRCDASLLDVAMERVGMLAAYRSRDRGGAAVGVMVTASHNPVKDNGVKIVDPSGAMLAMDWEAKAEAVARAPASRLRGVLADIGSGAGEATVVVGCDTRPHSKRLEALVKRGAAAVGAAVVGVGVVTTPQLHHCVRARNGFECGAASRARPGCIRHRFFRRPDARTDRALYGYAEGLVEAFADLAFASPDPNAPRCRPDATLVVDCAGGVGFYAVAAAARLLRSGVGPGALHLVARNAPGEAPLNDRCGAEHVQKQRLPPANCDYPSFGAPSVRFCSVDGDADRVVYGYYDASQAFKILDGDKIAALLANFVRAELVAAKPLLVDVPRLGVVQTAYANGAAHDYLAGRGVAVSYAKTGVKYVHHEAEKFDIGVYFEANGHGTVLFAPALLDQLRRLRGSKHNRDPPRATLAIRRLSAVANLANQAVGDALADALLVKAILCVTKTSIEGWDAIYADLPSRQLKQKVKSREALKPNANETRLLSPTNLQDAIDALAAKAPNGRAFVRPSGTEDVVRIYAEARTRADADALATACARAVYDLAGGLGDKP